MNYRYFLWKLLFFNSIQSLVAYWMVGVNNRDTSTMTASTSSRGKVCLIRLAIALKGNTQGSTQLWVKVNYNQGQSQASPDGSHGHMPSQPTHRTTGGIALSCDCRITLDVCTSAELLASDIEML